MTSCLISVAGNIDPHFWLPHAVRRLREYVRIEKTSRFYITPALDRPEQPDYRNGVLRCLTDRQPQPLKFEILRPIEAELGRVRTEDPYSARTVDLDLLDWAGISLDETGLRLPDPDICRRPFLAAAVLDVAPEYKLPDGCLLRDRFTSHPGEAYPVDIILTRTIEEMLIHEH